MGRDGRAIALDSRARSCRRGRAGTTIASAAPTPGGLGAAEAALVAALGTVEAAEIVVPAVFLYRLATFWLPILPGWLAYKRLESQGIF